MGLATRRAEETTARLQARAEALAELIAAQTPAGPAELGAPGGGATLDQIQAELDAVTTKAAVDQELARIKARLAAGTSAEGEPEPGSPPATPAGTSSGDAGTGGTP